MDKKYGKTPEETLKEGAIDLQDMTDFIEDMKEVMGRQQAECDTMTVVETLTALDGELELYNMEVANG